MALFHNQNYVLFAASRRKDVDELMNRETESNAIIVAVERKGRRWAEDRTEAFDMDFAD